MSFRDKMKDGTVRVTGGQTGGATGPTGPQGTRWGTTPNFVFGTAANAPVSFPDGGPPRIGDFVVSSNGIAPGLVNYVTAVIDATHADLTASPPLNIRGPAGPTGPEGTTPDSGWFILGSGGSAPAYGSGWSFFGSSPGSYGPPAFRKIGKVVYLRGLVAGPAISGTTASTIFTLPVGYRPDVLAGAHFAVGNAANGVARIVVGSNGLVNTNYTSIATVAGGWWALDPITFIAADS